MKNIIRIINILTITLIISIIIPNADAQLFKKITKGIEKVNKGLEKVNKGLETVDKAKKGKENNKGDKRSHDIDNPISSNQSTILNEEESGRNNDNDELLDKEQATKGETGIEKLGWIYPHVTPNTKIIYRKPANQLSDMIPVSEGIFATQEYNKAYGYSGYYGFWTIDGRRLTENRYENPEGYYPLFDNGAVVLKDLPNGKKNRPFLILYADGTARKLPETYNYVSQFHDGVAVVSEDTKKFPLGYCIDTKGNKIWPHLSANNDEVLRVGPLRDGLRLVEIRHQEIANGSYKCETKIGFIDKDGNWVIKPKYGLAQDFQNGYSVVCEPRSHIYSIIDPKGNKVMDMEDNLRMDNFSDGYFRSVGKNIDGRYVYYDDKGTPKESFRLASPFHNGYAFVYGEDSSGFPQVNIIDKDFKVVATLGSGLWERQSIESSDLTDRVVGSANLFTISGKYVVTPKGEVKIVQPGRADGHGDYWQSQIGDFFPGEYAPCQQVYDDNMGNSHKYVGYINTKGEYEVVICDPNDEIALRMLPGKEVNGRYEVSLTPVDTVPVGAKFIN